MALLIGLFLQNLPNQESHQKMGGRNIAVTQKLPRKIDIIYKII